MSSAGPPGRPWPSAGCCWTSWSATWCRRDRSCSDETLERRWGEKIEALGVYRDPVRSSHGHFVKAKGLRWVSLMLLAEVPWARRVWALPFLTVLAPSRRYHAARGRRHKTITDWARQMLCRLRRWLPDRDLVVVGDSTYATLKLLAACQQMTPPVTFLTRLRLDAVLHEPPPPRRPGQIGRPRVVGPRLPSLKAVLADPATVWTNLTQRWPDGVRRRLQAATGTALWYHPGQPTVALRWLLLRDPTGRREPQALLGTDPDLAPRTLFAWYLRRWQAEVTFQEVRTHLGVETQRQWSAPAIARTTPVLLGLFSWLILVAHRLRRAQALRPRRAAWYAKTVPTFADVLASVRHALWTRILPFAMSPADPDIQKSPRPPPSRAWMPSATRPDTHPTAQRTRRLCTKSSSGGIGPVNWMSESWRSGSFLWETMPTMMPPAASQLSVFSSL